MRSLVAQEESTDEEESFNSEDASCIANKAETGFVRRRFRQFRLPLALGIVFELLLILAMLFQLSFFQLSS